MSIDYDRLDAPLRQHPTGRRCQEGPQAMTVCKVEIPSDRPGSQAGSCPNPPIPPTGFCQEHFEDSFPPDIRTRRQRARDLEAAAVAAARAEAAGEAE